jgi:type III secretion system YscQ/HrcQ family protein
VPIPFELPHLSAGFSALGSRARRLGAEAAAHAAKALADVLETDVEIFGRAVPGPAWPRTPVARLAVDLPAVPAAAALEVDPALVVQLVDRLAGGESAGEVPAASRLTPLEQTTFELLVLLAIDGACAVREVEDALTPRLTRAAAPEADGALSVELEIRAGTSRGRARVLLPAAAVRALAGAPDLAEGKIRLPASIRRGAVALLPDELESLEPGDVLLIRDAVGSAALVLPGGFRAAGPLGPEGLHVEELSMSVRTPQIPVTLEVELCRVEVSLADLARLEPGAVLPLAIDRRGLVTLRAGDRAVARGELIEVDGALGIRIEALEVEP